MSQKDSEEEEYAIYSGKIIEVIWNENAGKLVLKTGGEDGKLLEFPIEHYNTARDFKMYIGRNVKLLVENGKITGLKPI